jgi:V8-like Glu-specific endopeptidase
MLLAFSTQILVTSQAQAQNLTAEEEAGETIEPDLYIAGRISEATAEFVALNRSPGGDSTQSVWRLTLDEDRARLHLMIRPDIDTRGILVKVFDSAHDEPVVTYSGEAIDPTNGIWTPEIAHGPVVVRVYADNLRIEPPVYLSEYSVAYLGGELFSVIGQPDFEPVSSYRQERTIWRVSRSIGKVIRLLGKRQISCSGFLISKSLFMTNKHCIGSAKECQHSLVVFGYESGADQYAVEEARCTALREFNSDLDFAVIELENRPGERWNWLQMSSKAPLPGQALFVVQHPAGEMKQVTVRNCFVGDVGIIGRNPHEATDFSHTCDTKNGSSGSPVADATGIVVGLHHWGVTRDINENRAVSMSKIVGLIILN